MKQIFSLLMSLAIILGVSAAERLPEGNRVVLKPAREFNSIVINGNAVVECKFHPEHSGYVVYYTDNNEVPRIKVVNYGNQLVVDADTTANAITSRITVLCHGSLENVVVNDGVMLSRRLPANRVFNLVVNGNGAAYIGRVESQAFNAVNNGPGAIGIRTLKSAEVSIVDNGEGKVSVADVRTPRLSVVNNGSGAVTLNGKARTAMYCTNGKGDIYAMGLKCFDLSAQVQDAGSIGCDVKNRAVVNILGSGTVMGRRYPREVEGNVENSFKLVPRNK